VPHRLPSADELVRGINAVLMRPGAMTFAPLLPGQRTRVAKVAFEARAQGDRCGCQSMVPLLSTLEGSVRGGWWFNRVPPHCATACSNLATSLRDLAIGHLVASGEGPGCDTKSASANSDFSLTREPQCQASPSSDGSRKHTTTPPSAPTSPLADEVAGDLTHADHIDEATGRATAAPAGVVAERAGRQKLNGRIVSRSPLPYISPAYPNPDSTKPITSTIRRHRSHAPLVHPIVAVSTRPQVHVEQHAVLRAGRLRCAADHARHGTAFDGLSDRCGTVPRRPPRGPRPDGAVRSDRLPAAS
jgi:hypothetical protein